MHNMGRDFKKSIQQPNAIAIIAEIKLASPTEPFLGTSDDIETRSQAYEKSGATAISVVLTRQYFKGDITFIKRVKDAASIPVLAKDFVIDERQIYETKAAGADAILLIARLVDEQTLQTFVTLSLRLGIEPVVEINTVDDLQKALKTTTSIIAVNARDLTTFTVDVDAACRLMKKIPNRFIKLGFSGIKSAHELRQYKKAGAAGVLVGTALMKAESIVDFITTLKAV